MKIAILGGTGSEGAGLGLRWAAAGHEVIIGSRLAEKGQQAAVDLRAMLPDAPVWGTDNLSAAEAADLHVVELARGRAPLDDGEAVQAVERALGEAARSVVVAADADEIIAAAEDLELRVEVRAGVAGAGLERVAVTRHDIPHALERAAGAAAPGCRGT